jgi:hypothetical protein
VGQGFGEVGQPEGVVAVLVAVGLGLGERVAELLPAGPGSSGCSSQTPPRSDTRHSQPRAGRIARNQRMGRGQALCPSRESWSTKFGLSCLETSRPIVLSSGWVKAGSQMPCLTIAGLDELLTPSSTCRS